MTPSRARPSLFALAGCLAASIAAAALAPSAAEASFPGGNGKIAFVRGGDIWSVDPDGSALQRLTSDPAPETSPAWSPDGQRIAFSREVDGGRDIWAAGADGADPVQLTSLDSDEGEPAWSPDGRRIVFSLRVEQPFGPPRYDLYSVESSGGSASLFAQGGRQPDWASDGTVISAPGGECGPLRIFSGGQGRVFEGTDAPGCPEMDLQPSWSPDGGRVAFTRVRFEGGQAQDIAVTSRGGPPRRLVGGVEDGPFASAPAWSPDGTLIAYELRADVPDIFVVAADGSGTPRRVTSNLMGASDPAWQPIPTPGGGTTPVQATEPQPAGAVIAPVPAPTGLPAAVIAPTVVQAGPFTTGRRATPRRAPVARLVGLSAPARVGAGRRFAVVARFSRALGARVALEQRTGRRFQRLASARATGRSVRFRVRLADPGRHRLRLSFTSAGARVRRTFTVVVRPRPLVRPAPERTAPRRSRPGPVRPSRTSGDDCDDFPLADGTTAQQFLALYPDDPSGLDGNGDGQACE